jgi:threonine/homoserine/homoserine lactone efflux protein
MSRSIAQGAPFLPQFVQPSARHPTLTVLVLGLAFAALTFVVKAPVALCSGALSARLRAHPGVLALIYRSTGAILVCLGVRLALERR